MKTSGNTLWTYVASAIINVASAIINSREEFAIPKLDESNLKVSDIDFKGMAVHLDYALGGPILEVNTSKGHGAASQTDFYTYSLGDLRRMMHSYVVQHAQYPARGYDTLLLRLKWKVQNQLAIEGTVKLELSNNLLNATKHVGMEDVQNAYRTEPRAQTETPFEAQLHGHGDCQCSLCRLTLTSDVTADPDMEVFKKISLGTTGWPTDHDKSVRVDQSCPLCCLAVATELLADLDIDSLLTLWSGTLGWIQPYANQDFRLVYSVVDHPDNRKAISLPKVEW